MVIISITGSAAKAAPRRDINLTADNGLYACLSGRHKKLDSTIHNAMVGYRQAIHTQLSGPLHQLRNTAHAVKQAILGMDMEMSEHNTFKLWNFATIIAQ